MIETELAIGIGVAVIVVLLLLWRMSRKSSDATSTSPEVENTFSGNVRPTAPMQTQKAATAEVFSGEKSNIPEGAFEAEVRMLIDYGNKVEAVRIVREKLGLDLKDAKDLVDRMESGAPVPVEGSSAPIDQEKDPDHEVRQLAQSGRLIEAIKLVRERKGLDLKEAKAYVERL